MLEDEEEPHLNTDQVGCERNGSRVESPSAKMPIVTGPKTPNTFFGTKILELGDGDHSPEWEARETGDTEENRRIYGRQAGETGGDRASIPGPTCPLLSPPLSHLNAGFPFVSPLSPLQEERVGIETENPKGMRRRLPAPFKRPASLT